MLLCYEYDNCHAPSPKKDFTECFDNTESPDSQYMTNQECIQQKLYQITLGLVLVRYEKEGNSIVE